jgi:hypothetical protein
VTRRSRPKKPSSSRGFAHEACGALGFMGSWGSWGLKTENQNLFFSFPAGNNYQKNYFFKLFFYFIFFEHLRGQQPASARCRREGKGGEGRGGEGREGRRECVRTDATRIRADALYPSKLIRFARPCGRIFTATDGKNHPRVKSYLQDKRGLARTSGRRPRMSRRKGRPDDKFYRRTSV